MKVDASSQASNTSSPSVPKGLGNGLGKDAFLKILVAQLKNQDPLKPSDGSAMVAQLAQFSTLEQLQNLNDKLDQLSNVQMMGEMSGLVGKTVSYVDENDVLQEGKVDSLLWQGTKSLLRVGETLVPINRIFEIKDGE